MRMASVFGLALPAALTLAAPAPTATTYTFEDLGLACSMDHVLAGPYQGLSFATTPYLAVCRAPGGSMALVPVSMSAYLAGKAYEVVVDLPSLASEVSLDVYDMGSSLPPRLVAYDAAGEVLGSASTGAQYRWATLHVAAEDIASIGLVMPQGRTYLDNLSAVYALDPVHRDDCKQGGWVDYGFRNQGQCVRFVQTGKDSR